MPSAPSRRAVRMFSIVCEERAGTRRCRPTPAARPRYCRTEAIWAANVARIGRVGHGTDDVDQAMFDPAAPVLETRRRGLGGIRIDGGAEHDAGAPRLRHGAHAHDQRIQARPAELGPALRLELGHGHELRHVARAVAQALGGAQLAVDLRAERARARHGCSRTPPTDTARNPGEARRARSRRRARRPRRRGDRRLPHAPARSTAPPLRSAPIVSIVPGGPRTPELRGSSGQARRRAPAAPSATRGARRRRARARWAGPRRST